LPSDFASEVLYAFPCPMRATCPVQLILLDLITLRLFGKKYFV
jgi:hypothetical protein